MDNRSLIYNHNPMKKINYEDLVVGRKYLVEMEYKETRGELHPFGFLDACEWSIWVSKPTPIYTDEESNDIELEMLVNVASRLHSNYLMAVFYHNGKYTMATNDAIAREAISLITACKTAIKEGER